MNDNVKHPAHYCVGGIETIDYIRAKLTPEEFIGYCKGNALKYISRAGKKGDASEDLAKAAVYLGWASEPIKEAEPPAEKKPGAPRKKTDDETIRTAKKIDDGKLKALYTANPTLYKIACALDVPVAELLKS